jgi:hypothetical protein
MNVRFIANAGEPGVYTDQGIGGCNRTGRRQIEWTGQPGDKELPAHNQ